MSVCKELQVTSFGEQVYFWDYGRAVLYIQHVVLMAFAPQLPGALESANVVRPIVTKLPFKGPECRSARGICGGEFEFNARISTVIVCKSLIPENIITW